MKREEVLASPEYWTARIQIELFNCAQSYMEVNGKNRTQLAEHLGVSKGYVTQLLNGGFDHRLSKLMELSLAFGFVPKMDFIPLEDYLVMDSINKAQWDKKKFSNSVICREIQMGTNREYISFNNNNDKKSA